MPNAYPKYEPRTTRAIGQWAVKDVVYKVYSISVGGDEIAQPVLNAARAIVESLELPAAVQYGFVTIHAGEDAVWLLIDSWVHEILRHDLYFASVNSPTEFAARTDGLMACVWELIITAHERDAWVTHTMNGDAPDFEAYLADVLE